MGNKGVALEDKASRRNIGRRPEYLEYEDSMSSQATDFDKDII